MIISTSFAVFPAKASALCAATCPRVEIGTCDIRRYFMPVRVEIHALSVSKNVDKSSGKQRDVSR
ncbi:MAG: hypothetical protein JRJ39_17165 [Deltaproteobacteria bacterium]|nr:hypothetical protein [Deltaproteobacteria bacterium]